MRCVISMLTVVLPLGLMLAANAQAGDRTYRWTDAQGRVHYSDVKNENGEQVQIKLGSKVTETPKEDQVTVAARQLDCQRKKDQFTVYNSSAEITETDSLGRTRNYSPEERQQLIDAARQQMLSACEAAGISLTADATRP